MFVDDQAYFVQAKSRLQLTTQLLSQIRNLVTSTKKSYLWTTKEHKHSTRPNNAINNQTIE
jgi:hypothetical protein